jgi:hypothetical protein
VISLLKQGKFKVVADRLHRLFTTNLFVAMEMGYIDSLAMSAGTNTTISGQFDRPAFIHKGLLL